MFKVAIEGVRPLRPAPWQETAPNNNIWALMQECWKRALDTRPTAMQIVQRLIDPRVGAKPTQSWTDWDETFSSRFRRSQVSPLLPSIPQIERAIFVEGLILQLFPYISH
jgi:hypothetical protein